MQTQSKGRLRRLWFQIHKWLGLSLAVLIIPLSLSGSALVWHDWLDETLNPQRSATTAPSLPPSRYEAAARSLARPGEQLAGLAWPKGQGPVVATLTQAKRPGAGAGVQSGGRPSRTMLWLDPTNARLLDRGASDGGAVRVLHRLHGTLMVPGAGRQIVGWIGVAMLLSSLTGLWLWWPLKGGLRRGLRWWRQPVTSGNLHHQGGFWIALPLAVLSLTGAWISFPPFFAQVSGDPPPPAAAERMRRMGAQPLPHPRLTADAALNAARPYAKGRLAGISWPTKREAQWKLSFAAASGADEVTVDDASGAATPPKPPRPETTARLMRRLHDGSGMGPVWQAIIFVGGLIPALLGVTGVLMWLNVRRRRAAMTRQRAGAL